MHTEKEQHASTLSRSTMSFDGTQKETEYAALEATQGQNDSFFSQLLCKCHLEEVASVGD